MTRIGLIALLGLASIAAPERVAPSAHVTTSAQAAPPAVYVAYYWRAKPGQLDAYNEYIRSVAVPIDEDARRVGVGSR